MKEIMKTPYQHSTLKAEGYLFIPYEGQLRFGVQITQGILSTVAPDYEFHHNFGTSPSSPTCRVYEDSHTLADLTCLYEHEEQIKHFMIANKAKKIRIQMEKGYIDLINSTPEKEKK